MVEVDEILLFKYTFPSFLGTAPFPKLGNVHSWSPASHMEFNISTKEI